MMNYVFNLNNWTESAESKVVISIGNYTVREVLMKNRTPVWQNVYNTADRYKHK